MRTILLLAALASASAVASGFQRTPDAEFYAPRHASHECIVEAAHRQGVPANVLLAICNIEDGRQGLFVENKNGSKDIGECQINTIHWGPKGYFENHPSITQEAVAWRGCYNAEIAAWLLRKRLDEDTGQDFWTRAANYHSKTDRFNRVYKAKLIPLSILWGEWVTDMYPEASIHRK